MRTQIRVTGLTLLLALSCVVVVAQDKEKPAAKSATKAAKTKTRKRRVNPAMAPVTDNPKLPRVLLIGDSISIGYTINVRDSLKGKANVHRPLTNCGPTTKGVAELDKWLGKKKWDVIHFNFGLHDLKYMGPNGENLSDPKVGHQQVPPAEYEKNLDVIATKLKKTEAKLIWRNTTPVPKGSKGRVVGHSKQYNEIAAKVMKKHNIPTHDMFAFVQPQESEIMLKANVHFSQAGYKALAKTVVEQITKALPETK